VWVGRKERRKERGMGKRVSMSEGEEEKRKKRRKEKKRKRKIESKWDMSRCWWLGEDKIIFS
jgi:hypothetical protein